MSANRWILDRIDKRLGSVEKEIKFDKILIIVGVILTIVFAVLLFFSVEKMSRLAILWVLMTMFGIVLTITMVREYLYDRKRRGV